MNPFQKNPFAIKNNNTHIVGKNISINDKEKIEKIKENMNKLKYNEKVSVENNITVKEKIDNLKNLDKWK